MKRTISILTVIFLGVFSANIYGQQGDQPSDQGKAETSSSKTPAKSSDKIVGTYLDVAHAREYAIKYDDIIKHDIYKLQVVVENYGDANEKSALKSIVDNHVYAKKELFKRKYLNARKILTEVKSSIEKLFQSLSERYQKQANDILGKCAENLVDKEIGIGSSRDINIQVVGKTSKKITDNRIRLTIAYDQLNMADKFKFDDRLSDAITHYRIAKLHGINILVDLADDENEKSKLKSEYKVDLADGENTISK